MGWVNHLVELLAVLICLYFIILCRIDIYDIDIYLAAIAFDIFLINCDFYRKKNKEYSFSLFFF